MQGEGIYVGTPTVFLRTYRCNLSCSWCDSKYTWLDQSEAKPGASYSMFSTEALVEGVSGFGLRHLVLTGGEPLLHQRALVPVLSSLKRGGFVIEVETNGTLAPIPDLVNAVDCFNVSPKLSNSTIEERARIRSSSLMDYVRSQKAWFKFVVREAGDVAEIEDLILRFAIPRERVILMPEGVDAATLLRRSEWLVEICKERGFRFTPRLHILLYGNKRGT